MGNGIAAVLIVKDGAETIGRCIKSLEGLDDVLIYDTGSADGTPDICRKLGATVVQGPVIRPFHFANARNAALEQSKHPWALTIDADEILKEGSLEIMRTALNTPWKRGFYGTHLNYPPDARKKDEPLPTSRVMLFEKAHWRWKWRIHERLFATSGKARTDKLSGVVIEHRPKGDRLTRRNQNLELLKISIKEDPSHVFALLQLGIEYSHREDWGAAIEPLAEYVRIGRCEGFLGRAAAQMHLAKALARSGDLQSSMNVFVAARENTPGRREPLYWAAVELIKVGLFPDAAWWLEEALKIAPSHTPAFPLYSGAAQGNLIKETLAECRQLMKKAEVKPVS